MPVDGLLNLSEKLRIFSDKIGKFGSVFILPLVFFTMWDVIIRKLGGGQTWLVENLGYFGSWFESTKIQEWEWHWHTILFTLVLGYGYVHNRHVRVDLIRENLPFKGQVWIEFLGCTLFLIPYCTIVGWFAYEQVIQSWATNEISASTVGLCCRWMIRSVLVIGLFVGAVAGFSVWLQTVAVILGPRDKRFNLMTLEWPEDVQRKAKMRLDMEEEKKAADAAAAAAKGSG